MHADHGNRFRSILQNDLPDFIDRVDSPWDDLPDYNDYNAAAFRHIVRDLDRLRKAVDEGRPTSKGLLVLGESGTGKTHLLMRVARNLAKSNHILFVRRPNDEESVAQHIWANIINSLSRNVPNSDKGRNQLDDLLAHVFSSVLIPEFEQDARKDKNAVRKQRWADCLREDPYNLFEMLGEGEGRMANMKLIRSRTLRFLQCVHPDVDQRLAHALISYCFVSGESRKRVLLNWLSGQEIDEREAQANGLPSSWVDVDQTASDHSYQQQREEMALRAIQTLGVLSTHYQPLILAFDQLEGLRHEERLTRRWGDVLREVFTMSPNFLIVTCIFPSLWKEWFLPRLDDSAAQRISQHQVELEAFQNRHGMRLLEKHVEVIRTKHNLPTSIYPFTDEDVAELCCNATSPRLFIQAAQAAFDHWLDADPENNALDDVPGSTARGMQKAIDSLLKKSIESFESKQRAAYGTDVCTEQDFLGRIRALLKALLRGQPVEQYRARWGHYVMPCNFVLRSRPYNDRVCIACLNSNGRSCTTRIRNFTAAFRDKEQFDDAVLIRDCRSSQITSKAREYLDEFERCKGHYVNITADEYVLLNAFYDLLVAIEEHNLSIGTCKLSSEHFSQYLTQSGIARRSLLLRAIGTSCYCLEHAINGVAAVESELPAETHSDVGELVLDEVTEGNEPDDEDKDIDWDPESDVGRGADESHHAPIVTPAETDAHKEAQPKHFKVPVQGGIVAAPHAFLGVDALLGDTELDSSHVGILGRLQASQRLIGISLKKPQCIVLLGYMGSGKSYALGILIENALMPSTRVVQSVRPMTVVAFNYRRNPSARFEYHGFSQPNATKAELNILTASYGETPAGVSDVNIFGYEPEMKRRQADYGDLPTFPIQFRPEELGAEHWTILMKPPTPQAEYMDIARDIIQELYYQDRLSLRNLERAISNDERFSDTQRRRARTRLSFAARWLTDDRAYEWSDVLREGALNIFDLRMQTLSSDEALKLCLVTTDLIRRTHNGVNKMVVFDEAHEYVDSRELIDELENSITQIRHDGLSFVLASQFPERIPERIFKYLATRFVFKLPTAKAINYLKRAAPNLKTLSLDQVANLGLEKGLCFVQTDDDRTDASLGIPQLLQVRPRLSQHGGATVRHSQVPIPALTE